MRLFILFSFLGLASLVAQNEEPAEEFSLDSVIHLSVANLKPPRWYPEIVSYDPAVSANSEEVQKHVAQGMALIHANWDFEAYRHFVEAVKKDPECLMAYWGISLSLAHPNSEVVECRLAAVRRMIELVEAGKGTASEQGQAEALAFLFSPNPERAPEVFATVSENFPNNLQLKLMASFFKRDGYDELLGPGAGQLEALKEVEEILMNHTDSQMALSFWIALQAEHPDATGKLRKTVLPRVRRLVAYAPEFPPYCELLGHFEKRAGNLRLAEREFKKAIQYYEKTMTEDGLSYYDCPNLIRAKLSLASVFLRLEDFESAFAIATELSELKIEDERLYSPGATLVLWEGKTLGSRLCLARGNKGDYQKGIASLPAQKEGQKLALLTPSVMSWEAWRHALSARDAISNQVFDSAGQYLDALAASDGLLLEIQSVVLPGSSRQAWKRARNALKVEWMLAKADLLNAQAESKGEVSSSATFWFQSAIDEREPPEGIFPSLSLALPPVQMGLHLSRLGEEEKALKNFKRAMADYANDITVLRIYEKALREQGNTKKADQINKHIGIVIGAK